jgi:hypothetical protein
VSVRAPAGPELAGWLRRWSAGLGVGLADKGKSGDEKRATATDNRPLLTDRHSQPNNRRLRRNRESKSGNALRVRNVRVPGASPSQSQERVKSIEIGWGTEVADEAAKTRESRVGNALAGLGSAGVGSQGQEILDGQHEGAVAVLVKSPETPSEGTETERQDSQQALLGLRCASLIWG